MIKKEFIRFIFVGIINTIVGYGLYAFFIFVGFNYILSALLATILGIIFNFQTIGRLVFKLYDHRLFIRFILVYIIVFFTGIIFIALFKNVGFNDYGAGLIALFPNAIISFLLNKFYVYRRTNEND